MYLDKTNQKKQTSSRINIYDYQMKKSEYSFGGKKSRSESGDRKNEIFQTNGQKNKTTRWQCIQ